MESVVVANELKAIEACRHLFPMYCIKFLDVVDRPRRRHGFLLKEGFYIGSDEYGEFVSSGR